MELKFVTFMQYYWKIYQFAIFSRYYSNLNGIKGALDKYNIYLFKSSSIKDL